MPTITLYLVHGSHPCAAVATALDLKGLPYRVREWPPPLHAPLQRALFGRRTVPAIRIDDRRISGSSGIFAALDTLVPEPRLYPPGNDRVRELEAWGEGDFQQLARDIIWAAAAHRPDALVSYTEHSRIPVPAPLLRVSAPVIVALEQRLNRTNDAKAARRIEELPARLDEIDGWIAEGVIGDVERPNAADLQILATIRLLSTIADLAPILGGRPSLTAALRLYPEWDGAMPAGALAVPAAA